MNKKYLLWIILLLSSFLQAQAFEVKITSDKTILNINEQLNLKIEVIYDNTEAEEIKEVSLAWIENFRIMSKSQTQENREQMSSINWKVEKVSRSINSINLLLSPTKEWEFTLWPVFIDTENESKETESINIKVEWKKQVSSNIKDIQEVIKDNSNDKITAKELSNKYIIYFLIVWLLASILIFSVILFYKHREDISLEKDEGDKGEEDKSIEKDEEDFEKEDEIVYPELDDKDFVKKTEKILYAKISKKYNIKNIKTKSYEEVLENLDDNLATKDIIKESFLKIQKLKYSNILVSKAELLELIKKI